MCERAVVILRAVTEVRRVVGLAHDLSPFKPVLIFTGDHPIVVTFFCPPTTVLSSLSVSTLVAAILIALSVSVLLMIFSSGQLFNSASVGPTVVNHRAVGNAA